jgi:hypothetical protein
MPKNQIALKENPSDNSQNLQWLTAVGFHHSQVFGRFLSLALEKKAELEAAGQWGEVEHQFVLLVSRVNDYADRYRSSLLEYPPVERLARLAALRVDWFARARASSPGLDQFCDIQAEDFALDRLISECAAEVLRCCHASGVPFTEVEARIDAVLNVCNRYQNAGRRLCIWAMCSKQEPSDGDQSEEMSLAKEFSEVQARLLRMTIVDQATLILADPQQSPEPGKVRSPSRMTVEQANERASKLAKRMKNGFFAMSKREQAKQIGCHLKTWKQTSLYKTAVEDGRIPPDKPRGPKTVSLTSGLEDTTGEGEKDEVLKEVAERERQEALRRLADEQKAEWEPSSLEPRKRQRHFRKRL